MPPSHYLLADALCACDTNLARTERVLLLAKSVWLLCVLSCVNSVLFHTGIACRFFGGSGGPFGGFGGFGGGGFQEEEEQTPKGNNVYVELEVTLRDLYLGNTFTVLLVHHIGSLSMVRHTDLSNDCFDTWSNCQPGSQQCET